MATLDTINAAVADFRESISESMGDFISYTKQRLSDFAGSVDSSRSSELGYIDAALWREEKELLVKYEWDKYTTTVKGFSEEFELLMQTATTKIKNDIKAITENYLIELGKFETNLRALEATANIEKISSAVDLDAYQMKLLKLESQYKSALQTSRGEYKALMDTTVAAFSSIASELQTAVPTGVALLTSKN